MNTHTYIYKDMNVVDQISLRKYILAVSQGNITTYQALLRMKSYCPITIKDRLPVQVAKVLIRLGQNL